MSQSTSAIHDVGWADTSNLFWLLVAQVLKWSVLHVIGTILVKVNTIEWIVEFIFRYLIQCDWKLIILLHLILLTKNHIRFFLHIKDCFGCYYCWIVPAESSKKLFDSKNLKHSYRIRILPFSEIIQQMDWKSINALHDWMNYVMF